MTVKELKDFLNNIPEETEVLIEGKDPSDWDWCVEIQNVDYKEDNINFDEMNSDIKYLILNVGIV